MTQKKKGSTPSKQKKNKPEKEDVVEEEVQEKEQVEEQEEEEEEEEEKIFSEITFFISNGKKADISAVIEENGGVVKKSWNKDVITLVDVEKFRNSNFGDEVNLYDIRLIQDSVDAGKMLKLKDYRVIPSKLKQISSSPSSKDLPLPKSKSQSKSPSSSQSSSQSSKSKSQPSTPTKSKVPKSTSPKSKSQPTTPSKSKPKDDDNYEESESNEEEEDKDVESSSEEFTPKKRSRPSLGSYKEKSVSTAIPKFGKSKYTEKEDQLIVNYLDKHRTDEGLSGSVIWKKLEYSGLLPNHTWQSMRDRYLKYIRKSNTQPVVKKNLKLNKDKDDEEEAEDIENSDDEKEKEKEKEKENKKRKVREEEEEEEHELQTKKTKVTTKNNITDKNNNNNNNNNNNKTNSISSNNNKSISKNTSKKFLSDDEEEEIQQDYTEFDNLDTLHNEIVNQNKNVDDQNEDGDDDAMDMDEDVLQSKIKRTLLLQRIVRSISYEFKVHQDVVYHALIANSGSVKEAKEYLRNRGSDKSWTFEEDKLLMNGESNQKAFKQLLSNKGRQSCQQRIKFLESMDQ